MDKKLFLPVGIIVILIVAVGAYFTTRSGKPLGESGVPTQEQTKTATQESEGGCIVGTTKKVVGRTYTITSTENYTIQGKSYSLCCWEVGEEKNLKKICSDRVTSPVGYDYGVLFESNKNTGNLYKSMETYREGSKVCQQFYNVDGTTGALNCQERVN